MVTERAKRVEVSTTLEVPGERDQSTERREQILAAAWKALAQVGFEKITTRRIAEAAGINIATLHYYFGSKEAVLTETLRFAQRWTDGKMRDALTGAQTSAEMMDRAFAMLWDLMLLRPGVLRFDLAVRAFRDPEARREAERVYETYCLFLEEIIERHLSEGGTLAEGLTARSLAEYMMVVLDGVILHHNLSHNDTAAERNLAMVKQQITGLMLPPQ